MDTQPPKTTINYEHRQRWFGVFVLILIAAIAALAFYAARHQTWWNFHFNTPQPGYYKVTKFDDGDTIAVNMNGKSETIRFIGVDTPETHDPRKNVQCYGQAAASFTKNLIGNQPVRLEADPLGTNRDRYSRLLRYVYLPDGTLVNAELIKQGYGFAYLGFPFTKSAEFAAYQQAAQTNKAGLWNICTPSKNNFGGYTSNDV